MTLVQLEYLVAVDTHRHFATAAEHCFVTQPTLSMQLQKLEEELGVQLFDRSRVPVRPTEIGKEIIAQARVVLAESKKIQEIVQNQKQELSGELRIGVIPTLAPYLIPLFVTGFLEKHPHVQLVVQELLTDQIVEKLNHEQLDVGLLVTPLSNKSIKELPLFYEAFVTYINPAHPLAKQEAISPNQLDLDELWVLNEGHCFRSQVLNICNRAGTVSGQKGHLDYKSGSLETLKRIVETQHGLTLLPELSVLELPNEKRRLIRPFEEPQPLREVSLVVHRSFLKKKLIQALQQEIMASIPEEIRNRKKEQVIAVK
ncbi:LysR family hydrogen peroxide-inducible transcriptional activator [Pontibacter ummariensis]|uniref:LysR family transcriptional regulator, hydrogen peroxide-inducible genes activator n=1 Tax=Pontibacter ummariensis TaxID=1610492 RepID=A0A239DY90_9BACT|nr:hydrogen peroxide-inducible genes activator [Pontibacter ummariensis]PRY13700.1 LysR family hydrogen peroxide-inducible transcriptional activator [Pontibacter ummariensis]SNS37219.1 LysR family transcriptional regulator, hydrogen peroxide-inducible genes activator [Pontibacter ummariensis]